MDLRDYYCVPVEGIEPQLGVPPLHCCEDVTQIMRATTPLQSFFQACKVTFTQHRHRGE